MEASVAVGAIEEHKFYVFGGSSDNGFLNDGYEVSLNDLSVRP